MSCIKAPYSTKEPNIWSGSWDETFTPTGSFHVLPTAEKLSCPLESCNILEAPSQSQLPQNGQKKHSSALSIMQKTNLCIFFTDGNYTSSMFWFHKWIQPWGFWKKTPTSWLSVSLCARKPACLRGALTSLNTEHLYNLSDLPKDTRAEGKFKLPPLFLSVPV